MSFKQKQFIWLLLFLFPVITLGQTKHVLRIVSQADGKPILYAKTGANPPSYSDSLGFMVVFQNQITVSAWNFADTTLQLSSLAPGDTLLVALKPQPEQLNEVLVNLKNSWLNSELRGFERWANGWLFLFAKEVVVADEKLDVLYRTPIPKLEGKLPRQLYSDVLQNIFLLGKDSVLQLFVADSTLYVYPPKAMQQFEYYIKPLLAQTTKGLVYREVAEVDYNVNYDMRHNGTRFEFNIKHPPMHNCGAAVKLRPKNDSKTIYTALDTASYRAAQAAFGTYIGWHIKFWQVAEDSGVFSPGLKREKGLALNTYQNLFAKFKQCYFLTLENGYLIFDFYSNQRIFLGNDFSVLKKQPFDFTNCPREEYLYIDQATGKWWLQRRIRGLDQLESVRPGDPPQSIILDPFVRNIRVHNGVVFYINERGELRIKRMDTSK